MEDEIVQYFVVNNEVKMSKGKVAAQVAHAATLCAYYAYSGFLRDWYEEWFNSSMTKIVLQGNQAELANVTTWQRSVHVIDEGRTEIPTGTLTVVGLMPMPRSEAKEIVGHLKLLH